MATQSSTLTANLLVLESCNTLLAALPHPVSLAHQFTRYTVNCTSRDPTSHLPTHLVVYIIARCSSLNTTTFCLFPVCPVPPHPTKKQFATVKGVWKYCDPLTTDKPPEIDSEPPDEALEAAWRK